MFSFLESSSLFHYKESVLEVLLLHLGLEPFHHDILDFCKQSKSARTFLAVLRGALEDVIQLLLFLLELVEVPLPLAFVAVRFAEVFLVAVLFRRDQQPARVLQFA